MTNIEDVLLLALTQKGKRYIFGAEAKATDPSPKAFDCSELVEWACDRAGVSPTMPDGAFNQWRHCSPIPVKQGLTTRGALLFVGDGTGQGRNAVTHVAWSLGDGTTIEARGKAWGLGTWPSVNRFDFAGLVPGVDYTHRAPLEAAMLEQDKRDIIDELEEWMTAKLNERFDGLAKSIHTDLVAIQSAIAAKA